MKLTKKLSFIMAPVVMCVSVLGAGLLSFPYGHEPKVPAKLNRD